MRKGEEGGEEDGAGRHHCRRAVVSPSKEGGSRVGKLSRRERGDTSKGKGEEGGPTAITVALLSQSPSLSSFHAPSSCPALPPSRRTVAPRENACGKREDAAKDPVAVRSITPPLRELVTVVLPSAPWICSIAELNYG
ncbi:uncharacterized protein DS421_9g271150 [Arachis hypogaea]|nr:uncharacterized protein DS421_9g271150 [Arachis hypogaea]